MYTCLQTKLLCQYVFNLAKYDQNYDIRDRVRFLRQLVLPADVRPVTTSCTCRCALYTNKYSGTYLLHHWDHLVCPKYQGICISESSSYIASRRGKYYWHMFLWLRMAMKQ